MRGRAGCIFPNEEGMTRGPAVSMGSHTVQVGDPKSPVPLGKGHLLEGIKVLQRGRLQERLPWASNLPFTGVLSSHSGLNNKQTTNKQKTTKAGPSFAPSIMEIILTNSLVTSSPSN